MPNPETIRRESDDSERMAHVIALMFAARGPGRDSSARQAQRPPNPGVHGVRRGATRRRNGNTRACAMWGGCSLSPTIRPWRRVSLGVGDYGEQPARRLITLCVQTLLKAEHRAFTLAAFRDRSS